MTKMHLSFLLTLIMATGCDPESPGPVRPGDSGSNRPPDSGLGLSEDGGGMNPSPVCDTAPARAREAIERNCARCHGGGEATRGGFGTILDAAALRASGRIVPNEPDMSLVYRRASMGTMPPAGEMPRPTEPEVAALREWIECGAPDWNTATTPTATFISLDETLDLMQRDLRTFTNAADRRRIRYISLVHLNNAGITGDDLEPFRVAVSLVVNSLSQSRAVVPPRAIDPNELIFRIDLRDYVWDDDTWNTIVDEYPYQVAYDQDSALFPVAEDYAEFLREETGTGVPFIHGDWLVDNASQAPRYYDILEFGRSLDDIAAGLNIDLSDNVVTATAQRAGFRESGVSAHNRIIERHPIPGESGGFWLSHDFGGDDGLRDIFAYPTTFTPDGGEVIFSLPNGMQAYVIANAAGVLLDKAPQAIVGDPSRPDGAVAAGLSCMGCHHEQGIIPKNDEVRGVARATFTGDFLDEVLDLYPESAEMSSLQSSDGMRFVSSRTAAGDDGTLARPITAVALEHEEVIDIVRAAATLGITREQLEEALDVGLAQIPPNAAALRRPNGTISRESFDLIVGDLVCAIGLGDACQFSRQGLIDEDRRGEGAVVVQEGSAIFSCGCP